VLEQLVTLRWRLISATVVTAVAALIAALIVAAHSTSSASPAADRGQAGTAQARAAGANPDIDPGTALLGRPAPGFTLTDQNGQRVSLAQFRGKAVVLAFVDSRCTTVCPLSTVSMTEAVSLLGPGAARRIQLLGIDANPDAVAVSDVRAYSRAHELMHAWRFLTGSRAQLAAVWHAYNVYVAASKGDIDHEPAIYLIDSHGGERTLYLTQMSYTSVAQQAQIIADGLSRLLPGHPAPRRVVPLSYIRGLSPQAVTSVPGIGGSTPSGQVTLGAGHPHRVVFAASWLSEVTQLQAGFRGITAYQRLATRQGLPSAVVIDETPAESSASTLPALLARMGGRSLGFAAAADPAGRLANGYGVQDLPWIELTSPAGKILLRHHGWLPGPALASMVRTAEAKAR
jgi:cytochrome oxidase Cu insertion factor (SCO1/SenC/PrrC family)